MTSYDAKWRHLNTPWTSKYWKRDILECLDVEKLERWIFFCFAGYLGQGSQMNTQQHLCMLKRDLVRQGHVTLNVSFLISCSNDTRAMIFFLFHKFLGSRMSNIYNSTLTIKHVTLNLTFLTSGSSDARAMIFFCFAGFKGRGCQIYIITHCNYQAWPCTSRSRDPEHDLSYPQFQWNWSDDFLLLHRFFWVKDLK